MQAPRLRVAAASSFPCGVNFRCLFCGNSGIRLIALDDWKFNGIWRQGERAISASDRVVSMLVVKATKYVKFHTPYSYRVGTVVRAQSYEEKKGYIDVNLLEYVV